MRKMSDFIENPLLEDIKTKVQEHADSYNFSLGLCSYRERYEVLGLPVSGETTRKLMKGDYVGKATCIKLLEFFDIPYTCTRKYLEQVIDED